MQPILFSLCILLLLLSILSFYNRTRTSSKSCYRIERYSGGVVQEPITGRGICLRNVGDSPFRFSKVGFYQTTDDALQNRKELLAKYNAAVRLNTKGITPLSGSLVAFTPADSFDECSPINHITLLPKTSLVMDFMEVVSFSVVRLGKFDNMQSPLSCRLQIDISPGNPTVENAVFTTVFLTFPSGDTQNNAFMNMDGSKTTNGVFLVSRLSSFEIQAIKFAADKVIADKVAADKAVVDKAIADKVAADNAIVDKAIADRVAAERAIADKAIANKALADRAIADKVAADKVIADRAIADRAAAYKAIAERAATDKATADRAIANKVIADKAIADKAIADKVIADKVIADKAIADKAIADKAVADKAIADKAVADKVIADKAIAEKVIADKVIADKAAADKAAADKAAAAIKWTFSLPVPYAPWTVDVNGRVTSSGGASLNGTGSFGSLGKLASGGAQWNMHLATTLQDPIYGGQAYQGVCVASGSGAALVGNFTVIISSPIQDGGPIVGMWLSAHAKASDLSFFNGNLGETWNPAWYSDVYCKAALQKTGTTYVKGLHDYGGLNMYNFFRYARNGTTITIAGAKRVSGPWEGTLTSSCASGDKVICFWGTAQGYNYLNGVVTLVSVTGGL